MEFRIADILDAVDASDIAIKPRTPVAGSRIEALVFEKIGVNETKRPAIRKTVRMGALAAVLIVLLSLSVAVGAASLRAADLFGNFFGFLSQEQKDTMDEISMIQGDGLPISVTENGTTVILQAAIGDDRSCYLKLQFLAQENIQLPVQVDNSSVFDILEKDYYETPYSIGLLSNQQGERLHCYYDFTWIDDIPGDNQLDLILEMSLPMDSAVSFIDEEPEVLTISALWNRTLSREYTQVLEGPWVIGLGKCGGQFCDLNVAGKIVSYTTEGVTNLLMLDSMKMSQLGMEVSGTFVDGAQEALHYSYPKPTVVMRDGTSFFTHLFLGDEYHGVNGELNSENCVFSVQFEAPLDLTQVDYVKIGDLVIPFSEAGIFGNDSGSHRVQTAVLGTHITLGDPDSLRSSEPIASLEEIGVHGSVNAESWHAAWSYAAHTEEGVQLAFIDGEFASGKLVYTITGADVITNIHGLGTKKKGFPREACLELDSNNEWQELEQPPCIREDGSFEEGWYLVLVHLSVTNDNAVVVGEDPYLFNAQCLLTLADLRYKTAGNYRCMNIDYFSGLDEYSKHPFSFSLEPGEEADFTIGYLVHNPDFSALRVCTTTGGERSTFVDLKLEEKAFG